MNPHRTIGDCLDAGVTWDQFATAAWDGNPLFTSADDAKDCVSPFRTGAEGGLNRYHVASTRPVSADHATC